MILLLILLVRVLGRVLLVRAVLLVGRVLSPHLHWVGLVVGRILRGGGGVIVLRRRRHGGRRQAGASTSSSSSSPIALGTVLTGCLVLELLG